jgi:hypothetical protein
MCEDPLHRRAIGNRGVKISVSQKAFLVGIFVLLRNSPYGRSENEKLALSSSHVF